MRDEMREHKPTQKVDKCLRQGWNKAYTYTNLIYVFDQSTHCTKVTICSINLHQTLTGSVTSSFKCASTEQCLIGSFSGLFGSNADWRRSQTMQRRDSNPGRLGAERESFLWAMPSPRCHKTSPIPDNLIFLFHHQAFLRHQTWARPESSAARMVPRKAEASHHHQRGKSERRLCIFYSIWKTETYLNNVAVIACLRWCCWWLFIRWLTIFSVQMVYIFVELCSNFNSAFVVMFHNVKNTHSLERNLLTRGIIFL